MSIMSPIFYVPDFLSPIFMSIMSPIFPIFPDFPWFDRLDGFTRTASWLYDVMHE